MKKLLFIATLICTTLSFSIFAKTDGIIPYQLSNPGTASCFENGEQINCPPGVPIQISSAGYNEDTSVFQFTPLNADGAITFPAFINGKTQLVDCASEIGDEPVVPMSCSNFGYPTTKGAKNIKRTFNASYNASNQLVQMTVNVIFDGLSPAGVKRNFSANVNNIIFLPSN